MRLDDLKFEFRVVNEFGETIISDFTSITPIDQFGGSESVDIHVASALRAVRHDLENYEPPDPPGWDGGFAANH